MYEVFNCTWENWGDISNQYNISESMTKKSEQLQDKLTTKMLCKTEMNMDSKIKLI